MDSKFSNDLILINIVEEMVRQKVAELIKDMDMCDCKRCRLNAAAIALNNLPPHYVTTKKGELLGELDDSGLNYQANVTVEVTKALMLVKKNPRHPVESNKKTSSTSKA